MTQWLRRSPYFSLLLVLSVAAILASCDPVPRSTFTVTYELTMDENIDLISLKSRNSDGETVSAEPASGTRAGTGGWDDSGTTWSVTEEAFADDATAFLAVESENFEEARDADLSARIIVDGRTEREHSFADGVDSEVTDTRGDDALFEGGVLQLTQHLRRIKWRP